MNKILRRPIFGADRSIHMNSTVLPTPPPAHDHPPTLYHPPSTSVIAAHAALFNASREFHHLLAQVQQHVQVLEDRTCAVADLLTTPGSNNDYVGHIICTAERSTSYRSPSEGTLYCKKFLNLLF